MSQNKIVMIPVHEQDFKKLNEFAEAVWIHRDLENREKIREIRRTLLKEVNIFNKIRTSVHSAPLVLVPVP